MISQTTSTITQHQEKEQAPDEVNDHAFVSEYNESDYSDFLYLAPPEFLPIEQASTGKVATLDIRKANIRPTEPANTGTTPTPVTPAGGVEKEYFKATFPPSRQRTPLPEEVQTAAERQERRPSFVEVTPVKVSHENDKNKDTHREKRHSHSSHESEPLSWWPEPESTAQHEWIEQGADEEEDVIEEEVWSDAFYE
ncbi:hypothetical protein H2200_007893 [Cladophialophora chaetospira]|uniref:Uncharacterized protein n=1 Tax=Cladophialophora chaetospira TaxID=386627 RepID=A0AA39CGV0_9EURO|nr:hypothetical protein H2200_007893 [Cladophialophora chaetospira]